MMPERLQNNRYRTISQLSSSRFSETFLAVDSHIASYRKCVIKQLKIVEDEELQNQELQQRFLKEAKILEELGQHSQIPELYAYFCEADRFYLVLEWIEGDTLTNKLKKEGVMNENAVKNILENMLPVIGFIHDRQIIHQDIKPNNIVIQSDGKPVLIDFGAVKTMMRTKENADNPFTINIGTPGFIAPEQAVGTPVFVSDLYSLGLTAIYLLTGKLLKDVTNQQTGEIIWRRYVASISQEFADVLDKAIAYNPRERYATATEMLDAIQALSTVSNQDGNMTASSPHSSGNIQQEPLSEPSLLHPTKVSDGIEEGSGASPRGESRSPLKNPSDSWWLKLIMAAIFAGIIATISGIFWTNLNTEEATPELETKQTLAAVDIKIQEAVNLAKNARTKSELKKARDELQKAVEKLQEIPPGTEVKAKTEEYNEMVKKIDIGLEQEVCDELSSKVGCLQLPMSLP